MADAATELLDLMHDPASHTDSGDPLWYRAGICRSALWHADMWFPADLDGFDADTAKDLCLDCPVRVRCLRESMHPADTTRTVVGIWGGFDERDRRRALRRETRKATHAADAQ